MPKSKIRKKTGLSHYNPFANILVGKSKQQRYGKKAKPVPGATHRITKRSPYMGSIITAANRREYEAQQAKAFIEQHTARVVADREKIKSQEDKSEEEINAEVQKFNSEQVSEAQLEAMAKRFGNFQANKELKHYSTWLKGWSSFQFAGRTFPVITERFIRRSKSIKDIVKVETDEESE